MNPDDG
jgi:hypothetical protein